MKSNRDKKNIRTEDDELKPIAEEAVFSAQYQRRLQIKHFLLTKRGSFVLMFMLFFYLMDMFNVYVVMVSFLMLAVLYLKNTDLSHERDRDVWLLTIRRKLFDALESEQKKQIEDKSQGSFMSEFLEFRKAERLEKIRQQRESRAETNNTKSTQNKTSSKATTNATVSTTKTKSVPKAKKESTSTEKGK